MPLITIGASMLVSGASAAYSSNSTNKSTAINYMNSLKGNVAQNKAIEYANLQNTIRTGYQEGILNAQRGQAQLQAIQQGYDISKQGVQMLGTNQANAAASGTIGASVDAVKDNINQKIDVAQNENEDAWQNTNFNFDTQLNDLIASGMTALQSPVMGDYNTPQYKNAGAAAVGAAVSTGVQFAGQYAKSVMNLGATSSNKNLIPAVSPSRGIAGAGSNLPNMSGGFAYQPMG